jgi:glycosyltransferase involved in cell wall biosynthesis
MNIVAISASQVPSTAANSMQAVKAVHALARLGHRVTLLVPGDNAAEFDALAAHYGISMLFSIEWIPGSRASFFWKAVRRARRLGPDLLYIWPLQSAVFGLLAGLPVLLEMHDLPSGRLGPLWYRAFLALPGRKRLALITRALEKALESRYRPGRPYANVVLAPNGVDLERFASLPDPVAARRQIGWVEAPTVLCAGHLYAGRGADLFMALAKDLPQARFVWVGGRSQDVDAWKARAQADGIGNAAFIGFVPNLDLPLHQAAADVLLMPYGRTIAISSGMGHSAEIASPMKMFEYMATGRAILASDLPVIHEVLDETNAVFCPPDDLQAWKAALESLLDDDARRARLARQAQADSARFAWTERARRILEGFPL